MDCTCMICGVNFYSTRNAMLCENCRIRHCVVCGKEFRIDPSELNKTTCSGACKSKLTQMIKAGKSSLGFKKICKYCGKEFIANHNRRDYCYDDHYATCKICKKKFKIKHLDAIPETCSEECKLKLMEQTTQERYGVSHVFQSEEFKENAKKTIFEKYGVDNVSKNEGIKKRLSKIMTDIHSDKERSKEIRDKAKHTMFEKYGRSFPRMQDPSKIESYKLLLDDPVEFFKQFDNPPSLRLISETCGVNDSTIGNVIHENGLEDYVSFQTYSMEEEIENFIHSLDKTIEIEVHNRDIIKPKELDLYLPQYKLGIECNPTWTHNSTIDPWGSSRPTRYHRNKSLKAIEAGIQLFHVYGYEWTNKKKIIKSMIRHLIYKDIDKYFARNLIIDENINRIEEINFLNDNHRQGYCISSTCLGLRTSYGALVAVMSFGKTRKTISKDDKDLELLRYACKLNTSVVGGASKLFKHFLQNNTDLDILSYSDLSHTSGKLYEMLGFKCESLSDPGYMWVDPNTDKYFTRNRCQKQYISQIVPDANLNMTEKEIMSSHGYVQVFDSGSYRWRYLHK